jgi:hypothetical protein
MRYERVCLRVTVCFSAMKKPDVKVGQPDFLAVFAEAGFRLGSGPGAMPITINN